MLRIQWKSNITSTENNNWIYGQMNGFFQLIGCSYPMVDCLHHKLFFATLRITVFPNQLVGKKYFCIRQHAVEKVNSSVLKTGEECAKNIYLNIAYERSTHCMNQLSTYRLNWNWEKEKENCHRESNLCITRCAMWAEIFLLIHVDCGKGTLRKS